MKTDIVKINHAMRNIRALVSKLSYTKRRSDMVASKQFSNGFRNEQTITRTNPSTIGNGTKLLLGVAVIAAAVYLYKNKK